MGRTIFKREISRTPSPRHVFGDPALPEWVVISDKEGTSMFMRTIYHGDTEQEIRKLHAVNPVDCNYNILRLWRKK